MGGLRPGYSCLNQRGFFGDERGAGGGGVGGRAAIATQHGLERHRSGGGFALSGGRAAVVHEEEDQRCYD